VTAGHSKNTSVRQLVVLASTRKDGVWIGANVPSVREETGYSLLVLKHSKVVFCCPRVQAHAVRDRI